MIPVALRCSSMSPLMLASAFSSWLNPGKASALGGEKCLVGKGMHKIADQFAEFGGTPVPFSAPERQPGGATGSRGHNHLVVGDLLDAPGGCPSVMMSLTRDS
jgi:hypothetical protein